MELNLRAVNPRKEKALIDFGKWWEGKMVARGTDFADLPSIKVLAPKKHFSRRFYTLLTHHTPNNHTREGILALGGVIYVPDTQQTLFFGDDAGRQLQACLGVRGTGHTPYGGTDGVKDGKTFVYLHPIPPELNEDASVYEAGPQGYPIARAFGGDRAPNFNHSRFALEQVLQAPWEALDAWLSQREGLELIAQYMPELYGRIQEYPNLIYRARMVENRNLIAIV